MLIPVVLPFFLLVILGGVASWLMRQRYEPGSLAREVATGFAFVLGVVGLGGLSFTLFLIIGFSNALSQP